MSRARLHFHGVLFVINLVLLEHWLFYGFDDFWDFLIILYILGFPDYIKSECLKGIKAKEHSHDST